MTSNAEQPLSEWLASIEREPEIAGRFTLEGDPLFARVWRRQLPPPPVIQLQTQTGSDRPMFRGPRPSHQQLPRFPPPQFSQIGPRNPAPSAQTSSSKNPHSSNPKWYTVHTVQFFSTCILICFSTAFNGFYFLNSIFTAATYYSFSTHPSMLRSHIIVKSYLK